MLLLTDAVELSLGIGNPMVTALVDIKGEGLLEYLLSFFSTAQLC